MAIKAPCPRCKHVSTVPDSAGGRLARCRQCGAIVHIPIADSQRKFCCVCRGDVTQTKRVKDERGQYYCEACWKARLDAAAATSEDFWSALEDLDRK
jgi:hypothetical protein